MPISDDARKVIERETLILKDAMGSILAQIDRRQGRLSVENRRARELTSELVKTTRDDERWLLASDEAVSHGLKDRQKEDLEQLEKLKENPYFARMVLREEWQGQEKDIEYKIGLIENSDCRIIDWRKAPVAKLYYEYKEGDDYSEEIQGRERCGTVAERNMLDTKKGLLSRVTCRHGSFALKNGQWESLSHGVVHPHDRTADDREPNDAADSTQNLLPQIASLLSAQQFELISGNLDRAMLIQGIAGSGKTTVALHRLAWLFADPQNAPSPERVAILVLSQSLKTYISKTLPALGVEGVKVQTLGEWLEDSLVRMIPSLSEKRVQDEKVVLKRPDDPCPATVERVKRSMAMLRAVEDFIQGARTRNTDLRSLSPAAILLSALQSPRKIIEADETKLLSEDAVKLAAARTERNLSHGVLDRVDDALFFRIKSLLEGGVIFRDGSSGKYEHIFADEVQDLSPVDLACALGVVKSSNHVTIVGDTAQKIDAGTTFPGWEKLRKYWAFKESLSTFVSLDLSYRSTVEILRLADFIQQQPQRQKDGRHGRTPIWFKCLSETRGMPAAQDWLQKALEKYPSAITAVLCRDLQSAKYVLSLLRPAFGPVARLGEEGDFTFEGGIVVTHAAQVRGLEFTNLLLWNPTKREYPADPVHRNLLYLAVSRARENVCIVTWDKQTDMLPSINSPIIRGYDYAREELEELAKEKLAHKEQG